MSSVSRATPKTEYRIVNADETQTNELAESEGIPLSRALNRALHDTAAGTWRVYELPPPGLESGRPELLYEITREQEGRKSPVYTRRV